MTWTPMEWDGFCGLLEEAWPGEFDDDTAKSWRALLDGTEPGAAIEALKRLLFEGRKFRPSVSELLGEVRRDPSKPTFDEAYQLMFGRKGLLKLDVTGAFRSIQAEVRARRKLIFERAAERHPLILSFIERQGIDRLKSLQVEDPEWGEKTRKELREAWERHCEAFDGREVAALASGRSENPRQLDPLASLQLSRGGA